MKRKYLSLVSFANNSTLTLTALSDGVTIQMVVDDDGAAGPHSPATLANTTWTAI